MLAFGFHLAHSATTRKAYTALLLSTGESWTFYGPAATPLKNQARKEHPSATQAHSHVRQLLSQKLSRGYSVIHAGSIDVDPDRPDDPTALAQRAVAGRFDRSSADPLSGLNDWLGEVEFDDPGTAQPVPVGGSRRVEDCDALITVTLDQSWVRPNGDPYLPRFLGDHHDVAVLQRFRALPRPINVLLCGPAGSGKTAVAEAAHGSDLVTINCHGDMTVAQLVGQLMPTPQGGWRFQEGPLTSAMREGKVLLADEINKLPHEVMAVLHSVTDGRGFLRLDDRPDDPIVKAAAGFCMVGTLNPDSFGSTMLPEALVSRFPVQITVSTDYEAARSMGVPAEFVTVAENLATRNARNADREPVWVPQMRELLAAKALVEAGLGLGFAAQAMLSQCPRPEDVPTVSEVLATVVGDIVTPLSLGEQI